VLASVPTWPMPADICQNVRHARTLLRDLCAISFAPPHPTPINLPADAFGHGAAPSAFNCGRQSQTAAPALCEGPPQSARADGRTPRR